MCDYSLAGLPNRLASEGETLVMHRFPTGSMGLAPSRDALSPAQRTRPGLLGFWQKLVCGFQSLNGSPKEVAVCVPPGARLLMQQIPQNLQQRWRVGSEEEVVFVQVGALVNSFRDAVRFFHGTQVLLQDFPSGIPVKVLSLGETATSDALDDILATASTRG